MSKLGLGVDVLTAARERIRCIFHNFNRVYVSFSGGKDSSVLLHLVMDEAKFRNKRVGVLFVDLEAQYALTIKHIEEMREEYRGWVDFHWVALPLSLRNAVSQYEPQWLCWDPDRRLDWVREPPVDAIADEDFYPFFRRGMEFEEFIFKFGEYFSCGESTACFVGIRSDESLNRYRTIKSESKTTFEGLMWTTQVCENLFNAYPIYDWRTRDVWIYNGRERRSYNRLYDRMHQAGLSIHQARICQPYGDDQRRGLWLFHVIEPRTWSRVVARVNGANQGALYARTNGNVLGNIKITRPEGHTWESFAGVLLGSMPKRMQIHFGNKFEIWLRWWAANGYPDGIPDESDAKLETAREVPSWRRVCKALLKNDYWCKSMCFGPHKSPESYKKYLELMKRRRARWESTILQPS